MGLKGYRLWVMGHLDSTPRHEVLEAVDAEVAAQGAHVVAVQVAFERAHI
jgi:hypothetical protein